MNTYEVIILGGSAVFLLFVFALQIIALLKNGGR